MEEKDHVDVAKTAFYLMGAFGIGLFFGALRYAQDFTVEPRPPFKWWIWLIKGFTAGAVGFLAAIGCWEFNITIPLGIILVALSGWGGVDTLNAAKEGMFDAIRRYVNRAPEVPPDAGTAG